MVLTKWLEQTGMLTPPERRLGRKCLHPMSNPRLRKASSACLCAGIHLGLGLEDCGLPALKKILSSLPRWKRKEKHDASGPFTWGFLSKSVSSSRPSLPPARSKKRQSPNLREKSGSKVALPRSSITPSFPDRVKPALSGAARAGS